MFDLKKNLEEQLYKAVKSTADKLECPVVFGHVCWGRLDEPGSMRLRKVYVNPLKAGLLENLKESEISIARPINRLSRKRFFLDFLTLYFFEKEEFMEGELVKEKDFQCVIKGIPQQDAAEEPISFDEDNRILIVPRRLSDILVGESHFELDNSTLFTKYLNGIELDAKNESIEQQEWGYTIEQIISCKYKLYDEIKNSRYSQESWATIQKLGRCFSEYKSENEYEGLDFIGGLQTVLLYVHATCRNKQADVGFVSHALCLKTIRGESNAIDNPVIILRAVYDDVNKKEEIETNLRESARKLQGWLNETILSNNLRFLSNTDDVKMKFFPRIDVENIRGIIDKYTDEKLKVRVFPQWTKDLILWNTLLVENLRNCVHEGRNLSFTFVIADPIHMRRSNFFEIYPLSFRSEETASATGNNNTADIYHPWNLDGELITSRNPEYDFENLIETVRRNVEKKNYSWFLKGNYALLWDSTFPSKYPYCLIRVKNSSWNVIINDLIIRRNSDVRKGVPMAIAFVRHNKSGGLAFNGNLVASFRKDLPWHYEDQKEDSATNALRKKIAEVLVKWKISVPESGELQGKIFDALMAISEDPNTGCMLIIGKVSNTLFSSMGQPWQTEASQHELRKKEYKSEINPNALQIDEITSLMAMDGATCLFINEYGEATISFRNSVMTSKGKRDITETAAKLDGEGSRKWSALIAASHDTIDVVIAVSQDGPIYIYEPIGNSVNLRSLK